MSNPLQQIQEDMAARLNAAEYFAADLGVFLFRPRAKGGLTVIQSDVDNYLAGLVNKGGKSGAAVMVLMPVGSAVDPNAPGPRLNFTFIVRVIERPMQNMSVAKGTLKTAEEICLEVLQLFHHWKANRSFTLVAAANCMVPVDVGDPERVVYDCRFEQLTGLAKPVKCALPTITAAGLATPQTGVVLATATSGAGLRYSLDGSAPSVAYSAPIDVPTPALLRVVAWKAGQQDSDTADETFT